MLGVFSEIIILLRATNTLGVTTLETSFLSSLVISFGLSTYIGGFYTRDPYFRGACINSGGTVKYLKIHLLSFQKLKIRNIRLVIRIRPNCTCINDTLASWYFKVGDAGFKII